MAAAEPLRVHVLTFPAFGHYMTIRDIGVGLAAAGHHVTFALCDQSAPNFESDALGSRHGIRMLSAGACPTYNAREDALRRLIASPGDLSAVGAMLDGVAQLGREMCACGVWGVGVWGAGAGAGEYGGGRRDGVLMC